MALTKVHNRLISGSYTNVIDFGAIGDGVADDTSAIQAAIGSGSKTVFLPTGTYKITSTINLPDNTQLIGAGWQSSILSIEADVVGVLSRRWCFMSSFKLLANFVGHSSDGLQFGTNLLEGQRSIVENVWVEGFGNDGISIRNGNLGSIQNVTVLDCGRDGIHFGIETNDCNAWTLTGMLDIRGNGRDGLHIESGAGAVTGPVSHTISGVTTQNNTRYGVYVGTRSNIIDCYSEANGSDEVYLDTYALGNEIKTVEGYVVNNSSDPKSNIVYNYNASANYWRLFQEKTQFSGSSGKGIRFADNDGTAGYLDFEKTAQREYKIISGGSAAEQTLFIEHDDASYQLVTRTQALRPKSDNSYEFGTGALRWSTLYAATSTINTSDRNEKQNIRDISIAEKAVASALKSQMKAFLFKDAFEKKGDKARIHFGVIAQDVFAAFEAENLDPTRYGIFCSDTWWTDADGNIFDAADEGLTEHTRLGVRYEELFAFIISTL